MALCLLITASERTNEHPTENKGLDLKLVQKKSDTPTDMQI